MSIDRMKAMSAEFDAMARLAEQYRRVTMTPVVDDDYPEVRHAYESALVTFLEAMRRNDRFGVGNRYHLHPTPAEAPATWQPIDTAPKDGTELLLINNDGIRLVGRWGKHNHVPIYGWIRQIELYGEEVDGFDPIGWLPLPAGAPSDGGPQ